MEDCEQEKQGFVNSCKIPLGVSKCWSTRKKAFMEPPKGFHGLLVLLPELCITTSTTVMLNQDFEYLVKDCGFKYYSGSLGKLELDFFGFTQDCNC